MVMDIRDMLGNLPKTFSNLWWLQQLPDSALYNSLTGKTIKEITDIEAAPEFEDIGFEEEELASLYPEGSMAEQGLFTPGGALDELGMFPDEFFQNFDMDEFMGDDTLALINEEINHDAANQAADAPMSEEMQRFQQIMDTMYGEEEVTEDNVNAILQLMRMRNLSTDPGYTAVDDLGMDAEMNALLAGPPDEPVFVSPQQQIINNIQARQAQMASGLAPEQLGYGAVDEGDIDLEMDELLKQKQEAELAVLDEYNIPTADEDQTTTQEIDTMLSQTDTPSVEAGTGQTGDDKTGTNGTGTDTVWTLNDLYKPDAQTGKVPTDAEIIEWIRNNPNEYTRQELNDWLNTNTNVTDDVLNAVKAWMKDHYATASDVLGGKVTGDEFAVSGESGTGLPKEGTEADNFFDAVSSEFSWEDADAKTLLERGTAEVFFENMYKLEGAGSPEIRQRLPDLLTQSRALFDLYRGPELFDMVRDTTDSTKMTQGGFDTTARQYDAFLGDYMQNTNKYRGMDFRKRVEAVNDYLSEATSGEFMQFDTMRSKEGRWAADVLENSPSTLLTLAKMYRTGGSNDYYAQRIHNQIGNLWSTWTQMGKSPVEIFQRLTRKAPTSTARPPDEIDKMLDEPSTTEGIRFR